MSLVVRVAAALSCFVVGLGAVKPYLNDPDHLSCGGRSELCDERPSIYCRCDEHDRRVALRLLSLPLDLPVPEIRSDQGATVWFTTELNSQGQVASARAFACDDQRLCLVAGAAARRAHFMPPGIIMPGTLN
ncbi:MAG: hypothetical protein C4334_07155 [Pyrinomonas sp.]|uniref:hypothetical protein n=1 Tax=Pyrinomonas sp. TaxID=2080306 RepID=UPI003319ED93